MASTGIRTGKSNIEAWHRAYAALEIELLSRSVFGRIIDKLSGIVTRFCQLSLTSSQSPLPSTYGDSNRAKTGRQKSIIHMDR